MGSGRHIPIVALTTHAMQEDRERCLAAGMDAYLAKPFSAADLVRLSVISILTITRRNLSFTAFFYDELRAEVLVASTTS